MRARYAHCPSRPPAFFACALILLVAFIVVACSTSKSPTAVPATPRPTNTPLPTPTIVLTGDALKVAEFFRPFNRLTMTVRVDVADLATAIFLSKDLQVIEVSADKVVAVMQPFQNSVRALPEPAQVPEAAQMKNMVFAATT